MRIWVREPCVLQDTIEILELEVRIKKGTNFCLEESV